MTTPAIEPPDPTPPIGRCEHCGAANETGVATEGNEFADRLAAPFPSRANTPVDAATLLRILQNMTPNDVC